MYQESPAALLEQILETFTVLDAQGVVCSQSPWFERILGYRQGNLTGKSVFSYIHPDDRIRVSEAFTKVAQNPGTIAAAEFRFLHHDGSWQTLQAAGKSVVDSTGEIRVVISARNVTERKLAEEALRESEKNYRDLVENLNDVIYAHDANGILTYISPVIEAFSGYKPEEVIGRPFAEFIYPDDLPALLKSFQETLAGRLAPSEFRAIAKSGESRWVRSFSRPIVKDGCVVGLRGVLTDISERKQAELRTTALLDVVKDISGTLNLQELLYRVEKRATEALPCAAMMTYFWDGERHLFSLISQYGFSEAILPHPGEVFFPIGNVLQEVVDGQSVAAVIAPDSAHGLPDWFVKLGVSFILAAPLLIQGRLRGMLLACTTLGERSFNREQIELSEGIARQLAIGVETAELYQAQQEEVTISSALARVGQDLIVSLDIPAILDRLGRLVRTLLDGEPSVVVLWQLNGNSVSQVLVENGETQEGKVKVRFLQLSRASVAELSRRFEQDEVIDLTVQDLHTLGLGALSSCHEGTAILCLALRQGKELIGIQVLGYPLRQGLDNVKRRIARGIAQIASLALANARLLEELERANRLKQDFVGMISHELRTPLNIILGYNELLREGAFGVLSEEQCDILSRMNKSTTQLLELINATLDLSRIQSQSVSMSITGVSLTDLFAELEAELRPLHLKSSVQLKWRVEPGLSSLQTDLVKLKIVLKNLIGNAMKFTDEGEVSTTAYTQGEGIEFLIRDTGIGIPAEARALIFEPFRQVDGSMTRRHGGVGLGLYIVRQLVELLGGSVSLDSEIGKGSVFRIWIPRREPERQTVLFS